MFFSWGKLSYIKQQQQQQKRKKQQHRIIKEQNLINLTK